MKKTTKKSNKEKFNEWMKNQVKSIYYHNNEQMSNAFTRIIEY